MNLRAYNYWASLLAGRAYPSVADLDPGDIEEFRDYSLLLDFSRDPQAPVIRYVGKQLRDECETTVTELHPDQVPTRSLLSRLTDHYLEILGNRAPVGFEAEFTNSRGVYTLYRGILMPLSSDGDTIDFMYGVINWKEVADSSVVETVAAMLPPAASADPLVTLTSGSTPDAEPLDLDLALELPDDSSEPLDLSTAQATPDVLDLDDAEPLDDILDLDDASLPLELTDSVETGAPAPLWVGEDADTALSELLGMARASAKTAQTVDSRSRGALYDALGQAFEFYHVAQAHPGAYQHLLAETGLKAQDRAPFTPIVKLVFGADYEKTRLTEYAAALSYAFREGVEPVAFKPYVESQDGGLKSLVKAERVARVAARGNQTIDRLEQAKEALRRQVPVSRLPLTAGEPDGEFVLLVARRSKDGTALEVVTALADADSLIETAIRRAARDTKPR
jgi:hypothetical protein